MIQQVKQLFQDFEKKFTRISEVEFSKKSMKIEAAKKVMVKDFCMCSIGKRVLEFRILYINQIFVSNKLKVNYNLFSVPQLCISFSRTLPPFSKYNVTTYMSVTEAQP